MPTTLSTCGGNKEDGEGGGPDDLSASDGRACAVMGLTQSLDVPRTYRRDGTKHASFGVCCESRSSADYADPFVLVFLHVPTTTVICMP